MLDFISSVWTSREFLVIATIVTGWMVVLYTFMFLNFLHEHLEWHR